LPQGRQGNNFFQVRFRRAARLAISDVMLPRLPTSIIVVYLNIGETRIKTYTPAVTKVEECTKADTGVGAAIAAGSQALKGTCALLVLAAATIISIILTDTRNQI